MTDSTTEVLGSPAAEAGTEPEPSQAPPEAQPDQSAGRNEAFHAGVEEIRRRYGSNLIQLFPRLEDLIRRRLGVAPLSAGAAALAGLTGVAIRLALALLVTALAGQWTGIPWGGWAVILVLYFWWDATQPQRTPPLDVQWPPSARRYVEGWTALLPTIVRESDLQELTDFTRRWYRLPVAATAGVAVAAVMLAACRLFAPTGMDELAAGSIVLLALLLFDFGTMVFGNLFWWALVAREARYDHHLFWASPADSPEIRKAMRKMPQQSLEFGMAFTFLLVLTVVLTSWDSPLVLPLAVGFIVIGYLTTIGSAFGDRAGVRKIVERARHQQLEELRQRIEPFRSRYTQLEPEESEQLRGLIDLHNVIRDAPTTRTTHTLLHAAAGLVVPTIAFVITVFGEVSAERFLDAILP